MKISYRLHLYARATISDKDDEVRAEYLIIIDEPSIRVYNIYTLYILEPIYIYCRIKKVFRILNLLT